MHMPRFPVTPGGETLHNFREKLKGSLLKGGFDKRVHIDLPVPLPVPTPPPTIPTPLLFSSFPTGTPAPNHPPEPDPKPLPQGHQ